MNLIKKEKRKMNKILISAAVAAIVLTSCTQNEPLDSYQPEAINFGTYIGKQTPGTKASAIRLPELQASGFGVFAYYTADKEYGTEGADKTPNFMFNQKVEYNTNSWTYTPLKYWPNEGNVSFFAYAPYTATDATGSNLDVAMSNTNIGDPTINFTVNETVKNQTDLLWGVNMGNQHMPFLNQTKPNIGENIKFQFMHALSRIGFTAQIMDDNSNQAILLAEGTIVTINSVTINGRFNEQGVLNLNNTVGDATTASANWDVSTPQTPITKFILTKENDNLSAKVTSSSDENTLGTSVNPVDVNKDDSYIMIIPTEQEISFTVSYTVTTEDPALNGGKSEVTNELTTAATTVKFEAGKVNTFNLKIGLTSVKFEAGVTVWEEEDESIPDTEI